MGVITFHAHNSTLTLTRCQAGGTPAYGEDGAMATNVVNLDGLIPRDDFDIDASKGGDFARGDRLKITDLEPKAFMYTALRKPNFQRETANWSPGKIQDFIKTFLDGDLVPAIILWGAGETVFVIDGAHRLSALIAWVQNDYGDEHTSRAHFQNEIPPEQNRAARKTRELIEDTIGSYAAHVKASNNPDTAKPDVLIRAKRMGSLSLQLQWVLNATPKKAEDSFFKINQAATPIDQTELRILKARRSANAIASRVITRNATGHKYWASFENGKSQIEEIGKETYRLLFHPPIETPIKTLDLPIAGRGYSSQTLPLIFETVNLANGIPVIDMSKKRKGEDGPPPEDRDGNVTLQYLRNTRSVVQRITGTHQSSLGLHPAVYFYSATGRHQPTSFLAIIELMMEMERDKSFNAFTDIRQKLEEFLLENKSFANQVTVKIGSGPKGYLPLKNLYKLIIDNLAGGKDSKEILALLAGTPAFRFLTPDDGITPTTSRRFSRETKSATFLKEALQGAIRCKICGGFLHFNSISIDHIIRKADGGLGVAENAQLSHPYCNSTYKN
jgi:hypothetical protein